MGDSTQVTSNATHAFAVDTNVSAVQTAPTRRGGNRSAKPREEQASGETHTHTDGVEAVSSTGEGKRRSRRRGKKPSSDETATATAQDANAETPGANVSVASQHNAHTQSVSSTATPSHQFTDAQGLNNNDHIIYNNNNNNSGGTSKKNKKKKSTQQSAGEAAAAALAGLSLSSTAQLSQDQQQQHPRTRQRASKQPKEPQPAQSSEGKEAKKRNKPSARTTPHNAHIQHGSLSAQQPQGPLTDFVCAICSTENVTHYAIGPCDHAVCSLCALRMRTSSHNRSCALCKAYMPLMLVAPVPITSSLTTPHAHTTEGNVSSQSAPTQLSFASLAASLSLPLHPALSLQHEADTLRADAQCDAHSALMYVHCHDHYLTHTYIQSIHCCFPVTTAQQPSKGQSHTQTHDSHQCIRECGRRFGSVPALVSHMQSAHDGSTLCMLCVTHRPLFMHEHEIFVNAAALKRHQLGKTQPNDVLNDVTQYTTGHPMCEFCRVHLFDATALYKHLQSEHLTCSLCDASMMFRFYRNPAALREHHRRDHFLCSLCESTARRSGPQGEDILCAFAQYEEFRAHMRDWHGERDCQRFLLGTRTHTGGTQPKEREIFDLDLGAANPPPVARARQLQQERRAQNAQRAHTAPSGSAGTVTGSSLASAVPLSALVPADMRIAGRVSGAGIFSQSDRDMLALQRAIDEERTQAEREQQREREREKKSGREAERQRERELARAFPALSPSLSSPTPQSQGQTASTQSNTTPTVQSTTNTSTVPTPHPLSLVGKRAIAKSDTAQAAGNATGTQSAHTSGTDGTESEREKERQREERRAQLAAAFGVSDSRVLSQSLSHALTHTPHTSLAQHNEMVTRVRESLCVFQFSPLSLLCVPLIPLSVCMYVRDNAREVQRLERQIQGFLSQPAQATLHCAPRPARDRSFAHVFAHYLDALSVEYDRDPKRYVCLLKTPHTPQTLPCTFSTVVGLGTGTVCVRETSTERERESVPAAGLTPFSSVVNNAFHAAVVKEERETLRRGEVVKKRGPVVYLMLSDELASLWGRPVDRPSARASLISHTSQAATTSQSSSFSVTRALTPAALLLSLRDACEREIGVSLEALVKRVCLAGPNALAFETFSDDDNSTESERDFSAAIALAKLLQREVARGVSIASANTSAVGASVSLSEPESDSDVWRFFRVFTDFEMPVEVVPVAVAEQARGDREESDNEREEEIDGFVLVEGEREGEKEEVEDAWDDGPATKQAYSTHTTTAADGDTQNDRFVSQRVCEDWEDTPEEEDSEWQAFLAERREKRPSAVEPYRPVIRSEAERLEEQRKKEEEQKEKEREAAAARAAKREMAKKPVVVKKATNPFVLLDSSDEEEEEEED